MTTPFGNLLNRTNLSRLPGGLVVVKVVVLVYVFRINDVTYYNT